MTSYEMNEDHILSIIENLTSGIRQIRIQISDNNAIISEIREMLKLIKKPTIQ